MLKTRQVASDADVLVMERQINASASAAVASLQTLSRTNAALKLLEAVKFHPVGRDPLSDRPLNLIEQVNQTFTYLATCAAVRQLLRYHGDAAPFTVNLGTQSGPDIVSADGTVVAEVFAATHPGSNRKLHSDVAKVNASPAIHKYVFFSCPREPKGPRPSLPSYKDVRVVSLGPCTQER